MFGFDKYPDPKERLAMVAEMMRDISRTTDPQELVSLYGRRMAEFLKSDGFMSLSRRNLEDGRFRVTRSSKWTEAVDPWHNLERLPHYRGGLLAKLLYGNEPKFLKPLVADPEDPIWGYAPAGTAAAVFIPHYDDGEAVNAVVHFYDNPDDFKFDDMPEMVWMSNLFGRAVNNLALSRDLQKAYESIDAEFKMVEQIQLSLLPQEVPHIETLKLASIYQTSRRAGGDYYDFFDLGDGRWGIFLADVSGHGTPAAVGMTVLHSVAHGFPGKPTPPPLLLHYLNQKACSSPATNFGGFATAIYAVYDSKTRVLSYSSAGHPEVRLLRAGALAPIGLPGARSLPIGISDEETYTQSSIQLAPGDRFLIYTDGITESFNAAADMFGIERLDETIARSAADPQEMVNAVLAAVGNFTGTPRGEDDRTLIAGVVT
jgi:sigma-B regulation protein RsbU (phosphoserine phosphatase)